MRRFAFLGGLFLANAAVYLALLLLVAGLILPHYFHREKVLDLLTESIAERAPAAEIHLGHSRLVLLPLPHLSLENLSVTFPGRGFIHIASLKGYPEPWSLFTGSIRPESFHLQSPTFIIRNPQEIASPDPGKENGGLSSLLRVMPALEGTLRDGELNIYGKNPLLVRKIRADLSIAENLRLSLQASSNFSSKLLLNMHSDRNFTELRANVQVERLRLQRLAPYLSLDAAQRITSSFLGLEAELSLTEGGEYTAEMNFSPSRLSLATLRGRYALRLNSGRASVSGDGDGTRIRLKNLDLARPRLQLNGNMTLRSEAAGLGLDFKARNVRVPSLASACKGLFPQEKAIKELFSIVQNGTLSWARVVAEGNNPDSLLSDLTMRGRLVKGKADLPMPDIDLERVQTTFSLSKTYLNLANLSAHSGGSEITFGRAYLGLGDEVDPISLYMDCRLDLSQAKRLLQRELDLTRVQRELDRIESLEGSANGSLRLTKEAEDLEWGVNLKQLDLEAKHKAVILPVALNSGRLSYSSKNLRFGELQGQVGQSSFQEMGGSIRFGRRTSINLSGKGLDLVLKELPPLLKNLPEDVPGQDTLDTLQGRMELERFSLKGPAHKPQQWDFHLAGNLPRLSFTPPSTSLPLEISADSFSGNAEGISWSGFTLTAPQTEIHSEGEATYSPSGLHAIFCSVHGSIRSSDLMDQLYPLLPIPKTLYLKAPLSVSGGRFRWQRNQGLSLQTDFNLAGGTEGHADLSINDAEYRINRLRLRHEDKRCILQGGLKGNRLAMEYSGEFPLQALLPAFRHTSRLHGEIEGDFLIRMNTSPFLLLGSNGTLRVSSLKLPERLASPHLVLDQVHVEGSDEDILLHTLRFQLFNKSIDLSGIVNNTSEGNILDLELRAESLDYEWMKAIQELWNVRTSNASADQARIKGTIELDIGSFQVAGFHLTPVRGTILVKPQKTTILMHKIGLCNFHPHGRVHLSNNGLSAEFFARTKGQKLERTMSCLGKEEKLVSGEYGVNMNMRTNGTSPSELRGNNRGSFSFQAAEGRIYRINTLAKILALLNTTEILFGTVPELQQEGIGYHSMNAEGGIQGQVVRLKQIVVNGKSMNIVASGEIDLSKKRMDLIVLVSPLKTVDRIISWIPIANYILGDKLISIPFRVSGKMEDPSVSPLPPEAVGAGVLGLIKRSLSLPVKVLQPLMPEEEK